MALVKSENWLAVLVILEIFLTVSVKAHACFDRPEYWMNAIYIGNCDLSEVCMIKTAPHATVSPQMWCIKSIKGWFTLARFCKINCKRVERKKFSLICFPIICFPGLIYSDQEPLWLLDVIEDDGYFFGCTYKAINSM